MKKPFHQRLYQQRKTSHFVDFFLHQILFKCMNPRHMDMDYAIATVSDLICLAPERVYKVSQSRHEIKGHYSRDDPAFVLLVLLTNFFTFWAFHAAFAGLASLHPVNILLVAMKSVAYFMFTALLLSSATFSVANRYFKNQSLSQQRLAGVEWFYCFDVHCNAVVFPLLLLSIGQFVLLPFLIMGGLLPTVCSNALYLAAACEYVRVTVYGFLHLPLVNRDNVLVLWAPAFFSVLLWFVLSLLNVNCTRWLLL